MSDMTDDPGAFEATLTAAVGDEPQLKAELRGAFFESASVHVAELQAAKTPDEWRVAGQRLKGLAASFGAHGLLNAVGDALEYGRRSDDLGKIERAIAALAH